MPAATGGTTEQEIRNGSLFFFCPDEANIRPSIPFHYTSSCCAFAKSSDLSLDGYPRGDGSEKKARGLCFEFNHMHPSQCEKRNEMLPRIFGAVGEGVWVEPPLTCAFGKTVTIGEGTYINSNLTLVDDYKITIGSRRVPASISATTTSFLCLNFSRSRCRMPLAARKAFCAQT